MAAETAFLGSTERGAVPTVVSCASVMLQMVPSERLGCRFSSKHNMTCVLKNGKWKERVPGTAETKATTGKKNT